MINKNKFATSLEDFVRGEIILIDKDLNWTSFDVVNKIRSLISHALGRKKIKVGHAGTLDPLATGLLIIATGKSTKSLQEFLKLPKTYIAEIKFGEATPSYDKETEVSEKCEYEHITEEKLKQIIQEKFTGTIEQFPPLYSAVKINGKKAYEYARKGKEKEIKSKNVTIFRIEILAFNLPKVKLLIECSSGTYVRSLARDLGKELKSCSYLTELERVKIGDYSVEDALTVKEFEDRIKKLEQSKII
jgi:tRNA pseudouridine55 synthase